MIKATIPWSAKQIAKMYDNKCLKFDNAIQRGEVWDVKKKSLFIDSLLRGYPVPPMYTIKTEDKVQTPKGMVAVFDCIDGKQRCCSIAHFKANEFALAGIEDTIVLEDGSEMEINGLTYDELPEELREIFDTSGFTVYYFTDITDDEISEMMSRLNNGKPLTNVENARIKAKDLAGLIELSKHQLFSDYLTETAIKGYQNEDITIKTYIQFTNLDDPCLDAKRARDVYNNVEFTDDIKKRLTGIFDKALETISLIENNADKKLLRKIIKKNNLLAVISAMELPVSVEDTAERVTKFFDTQDAAISISEEYNNASMNGTGHAPKVKARMNAIRAFIEKG